MSLRNLRLGQLTLEVNQEANRRNLEATREGQLTERYASAAQQLGHEKPAVRLAGVYAMARLADDWEPQRQPCIDVLCAYLRMPYEPQTAPQGEREVRLTVIRIIRDHCRGFAATSWQGCDLDFTGATLDGGDFTAMQFSAATVRFDKTKFAEGDVDFFGSEFSGATVSFYEAEFSGGSVYFYSTVISGGTVSFAEAKFNGGTVSFAEANFNGGRVEYNRAQFSGSAVFFTSTQFSGSIVHFDDSEFTGGAVDFTGAQFNGGKVDFNGADFGGGAVDLRHASAWDTPPIGLPAAAPGLKMRTPRRPQDAR